MTSQLGTVAAAASVSTFQELRNHLEVVYGAVVALAIVLVMTPAVGRVARRLGIVDQPEARRVNVLPIPRLGGLALFFGILVPSLAFLRFDSANRGLLLGAAVATGVGAIDDFRGLRWFEKLAGMVAAAAIPVGYGIWIDHFTFPFLGAHTLPDWLGMAVTMLWIVAIMNMINFLDGLDGLAAGVCGIASATFAVIALSLGKPQPAIIAAVVLGACLGFLRHNFNPARIFMGDSGALLLGFLLATLSVQGLLKTAATVALFFPLLVLLVPILDTSFVVAKRLKYGRPLTEASRDHLHHRFLGIGFSQRRSVLYIYLWVATLAAAALATRFIPFRKHGHWHTWPTVAAAVFALAAIGASVYMVYLLEIVKLANPRVRRRAPGEERPAGEERRRSA